MGWDFTPYFLLILLILLTPFGGVVWVKGLSLSMLVHRVWHGVAKSYDTFFPQAFLSPLLFSSKAPLDIHAASNMLGWRYSTLFLHQMFLLDSYTHNPFFQSSSVECLHSCARLSLLFLLDSLKHVFLSTILPWSLASYSCLFLMLTLLVFDGCYLVHATSRWPVRHLCLKLHTLRYLCFAPLCIRASHSFFCLC